MRIVSAYQRIGYFYETHLALNYSLYPYGSRVQQYTDANPKSNTQGHGGVAGHVDCNSDDYAHSNCHVHANTNSYTNDNPYTYDYSFPSS